jgi:hypothetical protein
MATSYTCDKCKKQISDKLDHGVRTFAANELRSVVTIYRSDYMSTDQKDLCLDCLGELLKFFGERLY